MNNDDTVVPLTPELADLFGETKNLPVEPPDFVTQEVPVSITVKHYTGKFVVPDVNAWGYMDLGIFAMGHWNTDRDTTRTVLIPYDEVALIEYDFDRLEEFYKAREVEAEEPAGEAVAA